VAGVRGDDDYVPASPPEHPGKHRPYAVERPFAVNLDGASPLLLAQIFHEGVGSVLHTTTSFPSIPLISSGPLA
jgi:hypothetical protein